MGWAGHPRANDSGERMLDLEESQFFGTHRASEDSDVQETPGDVPLIRNGKHDANYGSIDKIVYAAKI